jgi:hypothetical protein
MYGKKELRVENGELRILEKRTKRIKMIEDVRKCFKMMFTGMYENRKV